ncbi:hypothetical protein L3Q67_32080 [Saccharothrix sp. AJ9571]|nr:hypothetical protein L3Q67_32080 [Saccharothrix sp. AJ9571]
MRSTRSRIISAALSPWVANRRQRWAALDRGVLSSTADQSHVSITARSATASSCWHRHVTLAAIAQAICTQLRRTPQAPAQA